VRGTTKVFDDKSVYLDGNVLQHIWDFVVAGIIDSDIGHRTHRYCWFCGEFNFKWQDSVVVDYTGHRITFYDDGLRCYFPAHPYKLACRICMRGKKRTLLNNLKVVVHPQTKVEKTGEYIFVNCI
jgi:hypothetical protein